MPPKKLSKTLKAFLQIGYGQIWRPGKKRTRPSNYSTPRQSPPFHLSFITLI
jgi:hypothetical protein